MHLNKFYSFFVLIQEHRENEVSVIPTQPAEMSLQSKINFFFFVWKSFFLSKNIK